MSATAAAPRMLRKEAVIGAPLAQVWRAWSTSEGAREFFAPVANIELVPGGAYEITFDPADETQGTKGLKLLSYAPEEMLSFQWNAPPDMPEVRASPAWVVVQLRAAEGGRTAVTLTHLGWKDGAQWDEAFRYFTRAWGIVLGNLERRFASGPIDWSKEK